MVHTYTSNDFSAICVGKDTRNMYYRINNKKKKNWITRITGGISQSCYYTSNLTSQYFRILTHKLVI